MPFEPHSVASVLPPCQMAEQALKRLEEQLNCSICLDTFTDPKLLQCFHVYCQQCLVPLGVRDQQGPLSLTCPNCRQVTPIPPSGVAGLQSAFHINHLLEIQDSVKKLQNPPANLERAVGGNGVENPPKNAAQFCFEHVEEELKLYCETCGELICYKCALKGGKHHSHDYEELSQAFEKYKEEITSSFEPMEKQVVIIKKALDLIDRRCGEIFDQREAIKNNVHVTFRRLREVLTVRETELIGQLHKMTRGKLKDLAAQSDQIGTTLAQLNSCLHFMGESIKLGNKSDVLMMKANTVHQMKELTTPFQPDTLKPNTEADIVFSALADLTAACKNYGQIFPSGSPDPSKCHATGKGLEVAVVGVKSTAILHAVSYEGKPCEEPIKSLDCELVSEITGTRTNCSVKRRGQIQYEISYRPTIKGRHQLHIKVEYQHIRGSPSSVAVKSRSPVEKLGTPILTLGGVHLPGGVAITKKGEVVVTEVGQNCVSVLSPNGVKLRSFGTKGSGHGQFERPCGVTVDGEGNILVADTLNNRIQKFTAEGQFLTAVGKAGSGPLQFGLPTDIAFNTINNKVYVMDNRNNRIQVLYSDLTFFSTFGKQGSGKGQFRYPCGIACDSTGKVYVADTSNHRIQVFRAEGKFMFGRCGQGRGELDRPGYVAVDASGMVHVSEGNNHRVSVFTTEGQFVTSFGREGTGPGEFKRSQGLAVDNNGVVYVCDFINNRVLVF